MIGKRPLFVVAILALCWIIWARTSAKAELLRAQVGGRTSGLLSAQPASNPHISSEYQVTIDRFATAARLSNWLPVPAADDQLVRMPGTQPDQGVQLDGPGQCFNCHADYDSQAEPASNWQGSMMAQAGRDFLYWATLTVAGQDAIWAVGNPNATDICLRCHMPGGWLGGRSDPTNGSLMTSIDFDGVQCNLCHYLYDPFFETTFDGTREGDDWSGYWDETNASATPSDAAALALFNQDAALAQTVTLFDGQPLYSNNMPPVTYTENGSGQMFVSTLADNRRASFADANANHNLYYSRYHKSKFFCSTCHDISNPVLNNLGADPTQPLPTEIEPAYSYYHVERTFSEFMLSDRSILQPAQGLGRYYLAAVATQQRFTRGRAGRDGLYHLLRLRESPPSSSRRCLYHNRGHRTHGGCARRIRQRPR